MKNKCFTLLEILVIVLILGILVAVALPKYQTAVDESSFSDLNLAARNVAQAQEVFYLSKGHYTTSLGDLDIKLPAENFKNTHASIGNQEEYSYVKTSRPGLNNNCIYYFKHSNLSIT